MKWIQAKDNLPDLGKVVVIAKKSIFVRPGQENKASFFTVYLLHPCEFAPEFDPKFYLWCKAALHLEQKAEFNIGKYFDEKNMSHLGDSEKTYLKFSPLDWWLELEDPESKPDFSI